MTNIKVKATIQPLQLWKLFSELIQLPNFKEKKKVLLKISRHSPKAQKSLNLSMM